MYHTPLQSPSVASPYARPSAERTVSGSVAPYPSPARTETECHSFTTGGLGIYNYEVPIAFSQSQSTASFSSANSMAYLATESWAPPTHVVDCHPGPAPDAATPWPECYPCPATHPCYTSWNGTHAFTTPPVLHHAPGSSPAPSDRIRDSHRSSVSSSYQHSELYSYDGSDPKYSPRVKVEDAAEWTSDRTSAYSSNTQIDNRAFTLSPERYLDHSGLSMARGYSMSNDSRFSSPMDSKSSIAHQAHESLGLGWEDDQFKDETGEQQQANAPRVRKRRHLTTEENAKYQCDQCHKMFQRSYNYKAHMETHNPNREYPNPCLVPGCSRRFIRKTDLERHQQSVHIKDKNYQCHLCDARFARKDTLRRHVMHAI